MFPHPARATLALIADNILIGFSAISFILFGSTCFFASAMRREFERYGLSRYRNLVGALQLLGSAGLIAGFRLPWAGTLAAGGLALLMLLGVGVRIKIRDSLLQTFPAFAYMLLNAYLCWTAF